MEAPAGVQSTLIDAEAMELFDQTLADEAIIAMLNESLYSDDDNNLGPDGNVDTIRSLEKAPVSLRYDHPVSIYQRYITARHAWYESLPIGSDKKDRLYHKAQGLSIRYSKTEFNWCLDYKRMGRSNGSKAWTKEEMAAYLDWNRAEDECIEARVAAQGNLMGQGHRGTAYIWEDSDADRAEQEALRG